MNQALLPYPHSEHDACGIGFIARTTGTPGHDILRLALEAISCMKHRGGVDADGLSGDGAGILTQIPHRLLTAEIEDLPAPGDYAVGMLFLPADRDLEPSNGHASLTQQAIDLVETTLRQMLPSSPGFRPSNSTNGNHQKSQTFAPINNGSNKPALEAIGYVQDNLRYTQDGSAILQRRSEQTNLHSLIARLSSPHLPVSPWLFQWRTLPLNPDALGHTARLTCPDIRQLIIRRPAHIPQGEPFERFLFTVRKRLEAEAREAGLEEFYVASFSAQTVVYKGLMLSPYLAEFYLDLTNPLYETALASIHTRYSTNTASIWQRAQPFRMVAHNGEINTLQGNINWMHARESTLASDYWPEGLDQLRPIIEPTGSDSAMLDNALELLVLTGRDIHHSMAMLAPEAWENLPDIDPDRRAFYRYHAALMEPWDGPAAIIFTDGRRIGATLDRNGLRPIRYLVTNDDLVIVTSEAGTVALADERIITKGKLGPGQMVLVDLDRQIFLTNDQVKRELARQPHYQGWVENFISLDTETRPARFVLQRKNERPTPPKVNTTPQWLARLQAAFGYTHEEMTVIMRPMADEGKEPTGSMGDDSSLAVMSAKARPLFHYFKQRFAQVTNPPIDPLRETFVMSLTTRLGARLNLLTESAGHANLIELTSPVLTDADLAALKGVGDPRFQHYTIPARYPVEQHGQGLRRALQRLCTMAERAIDEGKTILILSDLGVDERHAPIPSLLAVGAVHHHLVRQGKRMRASLVVETGEVREVHHLACLIGYGANVVNPYLALATVEGFVEGDKVKLDVITAKRNFIRALEAGLLKIMSKMGISTVESYGGAQIFEAIGLSQELVNEFFTGTFSRLGGIGLDEIAAEVERWHQAGFADPQRPEIQSPGFYKFKRGGEPHAFDPTTVKALQTAVRKEGVLSPAASLPTSALPEGIKAFVGENFEAGYTAYKEFSALIKANPVISPRDMLEFKETGRQPIDISEVEPLEAIFARFSTAAMSHGALSSEAHETLAIAMNRLGTTSNSGEGGSAQERFHNERNDRIKQVASGRFGVTPAYLMSAVELQIKMAQGAKPGEGGQLPGHKVTAEIAAIRQTTKGTTLISPPPHHDIYSIEDLAQLIYDLKQVNPEATVSVKLVAEAGVGTVAAGVAKGGADVVHIAGHSGGTGASAWSSIKNAGLPWEVGLAETQQALQINHLRSRTVVRTDGGLQTGRDVIIAAMLGADQYSFGTAALVAEGCLLARACHSNTCPVGVATQKPELRAKFVGKPEHVMAYMHYIAQEVREILAQLGFRSLSEIIGRTELLKQVPAEQAAADSLDLSPLLERVSGDIPHRYIERSPELKALVAVNELNALLLAQAQPAIQSGQRVELTVPIHNTDRTVGATMSGAIAKVYDDKGLPEDTIKITFHGSAGQSFGAFNAPGVNLTLIGEANDYVGKGMRGGQIVIHPPLQSRRVASDNIIIGNTVLYGATGGSFFAAGQAGERFAVRNSGATAVIEGAGDHGCEYMTSGVVVILGRTGYNFGAGMSGGVAFVLDEANHFTQRINPDMVQLVRVTSHADIELLRMLIMRHMRLTHSQHAQAILENWPTRLGLFWKVAPKGTVGSTGVRAEIQVALPTLELSQHVVG
jgi:glutamate synthase (ferredoxin)